MASGDSQRVWFPEMLVELQRVWSASMTWDELATFCERITEERRALRASLGIEPPMTRCSKCGAVSKADIRGITIRSALFALQKLGVVDVAGFKAANQLDPYGRRVTATGEGGCEGG